ncbi:MAG: type II secretion system protein [Thermogutta sp.]
MRSPTRSGFTLTELLVAITIIAILAGLVWAGFARARETARIAKTKSTIAKINQVIMERYDSYRTRRVPIDTRGLPPRVAARVRLWAIRCIMAWEMPDRASDVTSSDALEYPEISNIKLNRPPLSEAYRSHFKITPENIHDLAELLYLTVILGTRGSRELFSDSEIGDTDGDGNPEFLDGWGRPIYFIRCPVKFTQSDIQPTTDQERAADHDPFDPMRVDPGAWRVVPLIFSAGPDGEYGITIQLEDQDDDNKKETYFDLWDHWYRTGIGAPTNKPPGAHLDNIHNHRAETMP